MPRCVRVGIAPAVLLLLVLGITACDQSLPAPAREQIHFPVAEAARAEGNYDAAIEAYLLSIAAEPNDPRSYYGLVESYVRQGNPESVRPILEAMGEADPDNACVHYGLGCLAVRQQDLDLGLAEAEKAVRLDPQQGHGYLLMGSVHYYAGRSPEALEAWSRAAQLYRRQGDLKYEAWSLNRTAVVRRELGDYRPALAEFERARELQEELGNEDAVQLILGNVGLTQADLGDLDGALAAFQQAIVMARVAGDGYGECWGLTNLSYLFNLAGDHRLAIAYADSATVLARACESPEDLLTGLQARATACIDLGDAVRALTTTREALQLADSLGDHRHLAGLLATEGRACLGLGRLERARAAYLRADSLFEQMGSAPGAWESLIGLCEIEICEGDTAAAVVQARQAHEACAEAGYAEGQESTALLLCDLERGRGSLTSAADWADQALLLSRRDGRRMREALALAKRANVKLALGDHPGALEDARSSAQLAGQIMSPEVTWQCEMIRGDVLAGSDPTAAIGHYAAAMNAVETVGHGLRLEAFRAAYLAGRISLYRKATALLIDQGRTDEALAVCERARASAYRDLLAASPTRIASGIPLELTERKQALEARLRRLQSTRGRLAGTRGSDRARIARLDEEIRSVKQEWDDLRADILLQDLHDGADLGGASPTRLEGLADCLDSEEALIEYALGRERSFCFVVRPGGVQVADLPANEAEVRQLVDRFLQPLRSARSLTTIGFDLAVAKRLREVLIDPVKPFLGHARHLLIVPDGPLHYLPFEALVMPEAVPVGRPSSAPDTLYRALKDVHFFADEFVTEYLPSASLLLRPAVSRPAGAGLLAMGGWSGAGGRLRHAAEEVRTIGRLFDDAIVETGERATESRFVELAPDFRYLHLSSHGLVDEEVPLYSGVQMTPVASSDDGVLYAHEVLNLRLCCDLVTLSACQTGRGRIYAGEGLIGLTRAFLYAGARRALVSLWSVNDASTTRLMELFYRELRAGEPAAVAISRARRQLCDQSWVTEDGMCISYAHPFFWAGFVLTRSGGR